MYLSQDEQILLIKKYQENKDEDVLLSIIQANEKLIKKVAYFFHKQNSYLSLDDLISTGYEGIILAINKFNPEKSNLFYTHAKTWIKSKIRQFILNNFSSFTIKDAEGRYLFSNFYKIDKLENQSFGYSSFYNARHSSSTFIINNEDDSYEEKILSSSLCIESDFEKNEAKEKFNNEILEFSKTLSPIEKILLNDRILKDDEDKKTFAEIAHQFKCSNQSAHYREQKVLKMFKKRIINSKDKTLYYSLLG